MKILFFIVLTLLSGCTFSSGEEAPTGPFDYTWQRYGISMTIPEGYEVYAFDPNLYYPEADPYNAKLYINENATEFLDQDSRTWTTLQVYEATCEEAKEATGEWLDLPNGQCLEYKIGDGDEALAETVLPTISFE